jgi:molecular chaperone HscB
MQEATTRPECWRCQTGPHAALLCPSCEAPLPLPADADLFEVLGLPRRLAVDRADLEGRYHAMSRAAHPDRHQTGSPRARELAEVVSAAVNRAYRTLHDPVRLGRYWLELHGEPLAEQSKEVPPALAADVFETQEKLEALREKPGDAIRAEVVAVKDELAARLAHLIAELERLYESANDDGSLAELKRRLSEIAYLRTLRGDVEAALGDPVGTDSRH